MYKNASEFSLFSSLPNIDTNKLDIFMSNSKTGGIWDLKSKWHLDPNVMYIYNGMLLRWDAVGNIHFGYIGASAGYSLEFLQLGAGMYQILSETSKWSYYDTYFDDPYDSSMIELGYNIYRKGY